jgi:hypothetical protein
MVIAGVPGIHELPGAFLRRTCFQRNSLDWVRVITLRRWHRVKRETSMFRMMIVVGGLALALSSSAKAADTMPLLTSKPSAACAITLKAPVNICRPEKTPMCRAPSTVAFTREAFSSAATQCAKVAT